MDDETRSETSAGAQLGLFDALALPPAAAPAAPPAGVVGGRRGRPAPAGGGGGYLDECTAAELRASPDLRLRELAEVGLSDVWLRVAHLVGYDTFMQLWRQLSDDPAVQTLDRRIVLVLRGFHWYEDLQRRAYIRRLVNLGFSAREIHELLRAHLGHECSYKSVKELASACRRADAGKGANTALSAYLLERISTMVADPAKPDLFPDALESALKAEACRTAKASAKKTTAGGDPRLGELAAIGLSETWLSVARLIGYDHFVRLWGEWSANLSLRNRHNLIELHLRQYSAFERYQRNRYIETLVAAGLPPREVYQMVSTQLGEKLSRRHVQRLIAPARVRKP